MWHKFGMIRQVANPSKTFLFRADRKQINKIALLNFISRSSYRIFGATDAIVHQVLAG